MNATDALVDSKRSSDDIVVVLRAQLQQQTQLAEAKDRDLHKLNDEVMLLRQQFARLAEEKSQCEQRLELLQRSLPAATHDAGDDDPAHLRTMLEEQFGVLEQLQVQAGEKDGRIHELETENDMLLERLAELTIQLEQK